MDILSKIFKPKLTFYTEHAEITENYPVLKARDYTRNWQKSCSLAYKKYSKIADKRSKILGVTRCSGIKDMIQSGYILTTWCDFTIETSSKYPFWYEVYYPDNLTNFLTKIGYDKPIVSSFNLKESPLKIPVNENCKFILKIWQPWTIDIPKGWQLMCLPVPYEDNPKYTACSGILSGLATDLNIHVFWHETNGRVHIPAGTPLCQLIPYRTSDVDTVFKQVDSSVKRKIMSNTFNKYNKM